MNIDNVMRHLEIENYKISFYPKPDITTYELSIIFKIFVFKAPFPSGYMISPFGKEQTEKQIETQIKAELRRTLLKDKSDRKELLSEAVHQGEYPYPKTEKPL